MRCCVDISHSLQRKYTREPASSTDKGTFHASFRKWLANKYPLSGKPSEDQWATILREDEEQVYGDDGELSSQIHDQECEIEEEIASFPDELPLYRNEGD